MAFHLSEVGLSLEELIDRGGKRTAIGDMARHRIYPCRIEGRRGKSAESRRMKFPRVRVTRQREAGGRKKRVARYELFKLKAAAN